MPTWFRRVLPVLMIWGWILAIGFPAQAQTAPQAAAAFRGYQQAPQPIHDLLNTPPTPLVIVSPKADRLLVADRLANPPITVLAQPMLRIAGQPFNPATNVRHHAHRHQ